MSTEELVTIISFWDVHEAQLAKIRLEAEGIRVFLAGENTGIGLGLYANALGGIKLLVAEPDADRASEILDDAPTTASEQHPADDSLDELHADNSTTDAVEVESSFQQEDTDRDDGSERSSLDGLRSLKHFIVWGFLALPLLGLVGAAVMIFKMLAELVKTATGAG